MNLSKSIKTLFFSCVFLAGTLLLSGCPGAEGVVELPGSGETGGGGRIQAPPAELQLSNISVFYANDPAMQNLISFNSQRGEFTAVDVDELNGSINIMAEAKEPDVTIQISWSNEGAEQKSGSMTSAEVGTAAFTDMPPPARGSGYPLTVQVKTSNGAKSYTTVITLKAPGADASLETLSVKKANNVEADGELLPDLGWGEEDNPIPFWPSVYDYSIVFKGAEDAEATLKITAEAASADSRIKLSQDGGTPVDGLSTLVTPPPDANAALLSENGGGPNGGDPETAEKYQYSWDVKVGEAGSEPSEIALIVTNGSVSNIYWILLVPPANTGSEDAHLSFLGFRYESGNSPIEFKSDQLTYNVEAPQSETKVSLTACQPKGKGQAAITYKTVTTSEAGEPGEGSPQTISINDLPADLNLPSDSDTKLVVTITVTVPGKAEETMTYTVTFKKSGNLTAYSGTYTLQGGDNYNVTGLVAVTPDGTEHTVTIDKGTKNWKVAINKALGNPVKFAVIYTGKNSDDTMSYRTSITAPGGKTGITLTFNLGGSHGSGENSYLYVQTAAQLRTLGLPENRSKNYYLANDIDLTTLSDAWNGPDGYSGNFNGNGKTIKLELSKVGDSTDLAGDTGLFTSLGNKAVIENFNIVVSTKGDGLSMKGHSHFGGVVGRILSTNNSNDTYTLRNVHVSGTLKYNDLAVSGKWLIVGGLIGEIVSVPLNGAVTTIENCSSNLQIIADLGANSGTSDVLLSFGGLVGKTGPVYTGNNTVIKNCYTAGLIDLSVGSDRLIVAGGIVGDVFYHNENTKTIGFQMTNSYSTMDINLVKTSNNNNQQSAAGGLIGRINTEITDNKIENCFALNPRVLAIAGGNVYNDRVIGNKLAFNGQLSNYALKGMTTGTSVAGTTPNLENGALNTAAGLGEDVAFFNDEKNWTNADFTEANWDFTGLNIGQNIDQNIYPKLKF
ncbi:MAG: cadherin-like beta sandwich domain-containing protein [Spirochaetaceae bacterium]|nr:cadherin-like beta sandwich domain-containing protein [Spirochaetaceae bacterium]